MGSVFASHTLLPRTWLLLVTLFSLFFVPACSYKNKSVLFKTANKIELEGKPYVRVNPIKFDTTGYEHRIRPDDHITVRLISNLNFQNGISTNTEVTSEAPIDFLVDKGGMVSLPMLGKVKLSGMTKQMAADTLQQLYSQSFVNPSVEVNVLGLSVQVLGEVERPGVYPLQREKTTLVEVLASAGGITAFGKKRYVKIIRGIAEKRDPEQIIFDLTQIEAVKPELLILRDKDIIYVEPRDISLVGQALSPYANLVSVITSLGAVTLIVFQLTRTK